MEAFMEMMAKGFAKGKGKGMDKGKGKGKGERTLNDFEPDTKVWVGNLSASTTFKELQDHFAQVAKPIWCEVFTNKSGATTGGVAYKTAEEAANAATMLSGSVLAGQTLELDKWTQKTPSGEGGVKRKWNDDGQPPRKWNDDGQNDMFVQMAKMMKGMGKGGGKWGGDSWGSSWSNKPAKPVDESGGILGEFEGTIRSFAEPSGYGFIECDVIKAQYGKDVFLYHAQKKGYQVGMKVKFTCFLTGKGAPQAKDLKSGLK